MLLTVALPTYNRSNFLVRALNSILSQYDDRVEVLVSDNASTDDTQKIVEDFKLKNPKINYVRNKENIGPDANFLQCYRLAHGKYILLLGDDDLIVENSLVKLLEFIETSDSQCALIFLNHVFFEKEYSSLINCSAPFFKNRQSFITEDKSVFMEIAQHRLTYMSSFLLRCDSFAAVSNPEKYVNTSFMHTCIVFEATQGENVKFGVFSTPCIAQDEAMENTFFGRNPQEILVVFGEREENVFCNIAPQFGYKKEQMEKIYTDFIRKSWRGSFIRIKATANQYWKDYYLRYGKPIIKRHKKALKNLKLYAICPAWVAKFLYKFVRPLYRGVKRKLKKI